VYVRRGGDKQVQVFNVTCPHAGCAVEFQAEKSGYFCPCHNSLFSPDGKRSDNSPSARDLDTLKFEIRKDGEIWVEFQNFETGKAHKVAVS
jgi:menaquinol-cytochrome c reductase iron-sulfur subunit